MKRLTLVAQFVLLSMLIACPSRAGELVPDFTGGRIGARIKDLNFPATLSKDLASGLTNRILVRVELLSGTRVAAKSTAEVTVKYDLWDENYRVIVVVDGHVTVDSLYATLAEVRAFLRDLHVPTPFAPGGSTSTEALALRVQVLLNPLDRERMEHIREWVKQNSTPAPSDPTSPDAAAPVGAAASNALFDRIFAQYAGGTDLAAAWHESVDSKPFKVEGPSHEPR